MFAEGRERPHNFIDPEATARAAKEAALERAKQELGLAGAPDQQQSLQERARGSERPSNADIATVLGEILKRRAGKRRPGESRFGADKGKFKVRAKGLRDDEREDRYAGWTDEDFATAYAEMEALEHPTEG